MSPVCTGLNANMRGFISRDDFSGVSRHFTDNIRCPNKTALWKRRIRDLGLVLVVGSDVPGDFLSEGGGVIVPLFGFVCDSHYTCSCHGRQYLS